MTDQIRDDINRGKRAELLLRDELLNEAFAKLEANYLALWQQTKPLDHDVRESLWHSYKTVGEVRTALHRFIDSGTLAQRELNK